MTGTSFLRRGLGTLGEPDLAELIREEVLEGSSIEFKESLPSRDREGDPWTRGENRVGEKARDAILGELVAFANADGGVLFIGVEESGGHPRRAIALSPVPRCHDLAHRFSLMARDGIEPQLPILEVHAVATNPDGAGVLVFHVGKSRMAPHRVKATLQCTIRRADRCESMSMREIQELTRARDRMAAELDERFRRRADQFAAALPEGPGERALYARATLVPVADDVYIDHV